MFPQPAHVVGRRRPSRWPMPHACCRSLVTAEVLARRLTAPGEQDYKTLSTLECQETVLYAFFHFHEKLAGAAQIAGRDGLGGRPAGIEHGGKCCSGSRRGRARTAVFSRRSHCPGPPAQL